MILTKSRSDATGRRIRALVEKGLADKHVSARRASIDVVGHDGLIRDIRAGRIPSVDRLEALFQYLGIGFLMGGEAKPAPVGFAEPAGAGSQIRDAALAAKTGKDKAADGGDALGQGFLPVPYHVKDPAHRGAAPVALARAWLAAQGLAPEALSFLTVPDESMAPALPAGSLALIQNGAEREENTIWACSESGQVLFARVGWPQPGSLLLTFDGAGRAPRLLSGKEAGSVALLGRVVWVGNPGL